MSEINAIAASVASPNARLDAKTSEDKLAKLNQSLAKAKELDEAVRKEPEVVQKIAAMRRAKAREEVDQIKKRIAELGNIAFLDPKALGAAIKFMSRQLATAAKEYAAAGPSSVPSARDDDEKFVADLRDVRTRLKVMHEIQMRKAVGTGVDPRQIEKDAEDFEEASAEIEAASEEILSWHGIRGVSTRQPAHIPTVGFDLVVRGKRGRDEQDKEADEPAKVASGTPNPVPPDHAVNAAPPNRPDHAGPPGNPGSGETKPGKRVGQTSEEVAVHHRTVAWQKVEVLKEQLLALGKTRDPAEFAKSAVRIARDLVDAVKEHNSPVHPDGQDKDEKHNNDVKDREAGLDARFVGEVRSLYGQLHAAMGPQLAEGGANAEAGHALKDMRAAGQELEQALSAEPTAPPGAEVDILA